MTTSTLPAHGLDRGNPGGGLHIAARRQTLDGFVTERGCSNGVDLRSLEAGSVLLVHTQHSCYRLVVLDGTARRVLVNGGVQFPESTEARLVGATAGGSMVKIGWVGVGLRMELLHGRDRVTTSAVDRITVGCAHQACEPSAIS